MRLYDAHLHIIDHRFPLVANQGFRPAEFTCADYLARMEGYALCGGAVVSGSFQAFDQTYLTEALERLGPAFVGVTQLPEAVPDEELIRLDGRGVRGLRFNLKRGGSAGISCLDRLARRAHEVAGWHVELYVDAREIGDLAPTIAALPAASIDHLGLSAEGFGSVLWLAEHGVRVKATGFGRGDLDIKQSLRDLHAANPEALMFGTDLPSTRAERPFSDDDYVLVLDALGESEATRVFCGNAVEFYRPRERAC